MQILLDTHIFLWWLSDDSALSARARELITDADNVYLSSISIWEIVIKSKLGKLQADIDEIVESIKTQGFKEIPFTASHAQVINELPDIHKDPFDRALLAQAIHEPLRLITVDKALKDYSELVELV